MALVVKNPPVNAGDIRDLGSIPGSRGSLGGGHGNPLQYCCLEDPMDREARRAPVHRVAKSQIWLSIHTHKVNQLYVYIYPLSFGPPSDSPLHATRLGHHGYQVELPELYSRFPLYFTNDSNLISMYPFPCLSITTQTIHNFSAPNYPRDQQRLREATI